MKKENRNRIFIRLNSAFLAVILIFFLIGGMTSFLSIALSSNSVGAILEKTDLNKLYLFFFGFENKYYTQNKPGLNDVPLTKIGFQLATNIKINDIRSFFERELPGFAEFNTKIQVAGKGTDITSIPIESAPPMEVLLKEREIANEALKENNAAEHPIQKPVQTTNGKKVVYIYHTHSWESYLPLLKWAQSPSEAINSNNAVNVVGVGNMLAADLEAEGIGTEHSIINTAKMLHEKGWNANNAYQYSRGLVEQAMAGDSDLKFMIDLHRDSLRRVKTTCRVNNKSYARLDFIIGEANPNFKQNLAMAKELHAAIEKKYPGLSRGVFSKDKSMGNGVYNQDLSPRAILIEVGGVDNNLTELQNSMEAFSEVFSDYYWKLRNARQI